MIKRKIYFITLLLLTAHVVMSQSLKVLKPLDAIENSSVLAQYKNQFGKYEMPDRDLTFPFALIRMRLEGTGTEVTIAQQILCLYLGTQIVVADMDRSQTNEILFLVPITAKNIYITCGNGCTEQLLASGIRLRPNMVYTCQVHYEQEKIAEHLPNGSFAEQTIEKQQTLLDAYSKYNVSYPEFCYNFERYNNKNNPAVAYYHNKYNGCQLAGAILLPIPAAVALGTGLGIGAENKSMDPEIKAAVIIGSICGAALPSIICYSVAPVYKKKAWKAYRKPYDDIVKNNKYASASLSLQFSPVISYDMAGIGLRLNLY